MALEDEKKKSPYAVDADTLYERFRSERPSYTGTFDNQLTELYDRISNRPAFQYDATTDPLYQSMKDEYIQGGKLAMRDTMGKAAALTGGYGSSYGQQAGQQAFDAYLQNLSAVVPELYSQAYGRWNDEGDRMLQQYALLGQQRDTEYGRFRDELSDWESERAYQTQLEAEEYARRMAEENTAYSRQQQAFSNLYALIGSTGYNPTDEELAAAGMSREAADALRGEYTRSITPVATGGGSSGGGGRSGGGYSGTAPDGRDAATVQQELNAMGAGLAVDGVWGPKSQAAWEKYMGSGGSGGNGAAAGASAGVGGKTGESVIPDQSASDAYAYIQYLRSLGYSDSSQIIQSFARAHGITLNSGNGGR